MPAWTQAESKRLIRLPEVTAEQIALVVLPRPGVSLEQVPLPGQARFPGSSKLHWRNNKPGGEIHPSLAPTQAEASM